jgi:hypothetical protein
MKSITRKQTLVGAVAGVCFLGLTCLALADAPSGAIFTTVADGSEVNFNHYPSKEAVYLDGGPGPGAPQAAAGLDDGTYVFQVTDPPGKTLLSTDPASCRQFTVVGGIITGVVPSACQHLTGDDIDHGAKTVQLMPYDDTPNHGGVYKVWVTRVEDYLGDADRTPGNSFGFVPADSKTDNFKVKEPRIVEIDTRFYDRASGEILDGLMVTWIDTLGASNEKWSYWAPNLCVFHEAHVEAVETGFHTIVIADQPPWTIAYIVAPDGSVTYGPGSVVVHIQNLNKDRTVFIDVYVDRVP